MNNFDQQNRNAKTYGVIGMIIAALLLAGVFYFTDDSQVECRVNRMKFEPWECVR